MLTLKQDSYVVERTKLYDGSASFDNCECSDCHKTDYTIEHSVKPLLLPSKLVEAIEMLLWYSPNVDAEQAFKNEYLKDPLYDDAIINYFLMYSGMDNSDICFVDEYQLPECFLKPYLKRACNNCQKIIVTRNDHESKITCVLRHMRNCIAHGRFNTINHSRVIGFDMRSGKYTAVFLIDIESLHRFCEQLIKFPDFTISHIFQYALLHNKTHHIIMPVVTGGYNFRDKETNEELVFVKEDSNTYRINCSRYKNGIDFFENIEEYIFQEDIDFGEAIDFIDLYYCEVLNEIINQIADNKYLIGKKFLIEMVKGIELSKLLKV